MWIYLRESQVSPSLCQSGSDRLPIVKTTHMLKEFYLHGWLIDTYPLHPSGMMSEPLKDQICPLDQTSSMGGFHARIFPVQDGERVWKETEVDLCLKYSDLQKKLEFRFCSSKMSLRLELEDFENSSEHLPIYGMIVDGQLFLPQKLEPHTLDEDGSYWATPNTMDTMEPRTPEAMQKHLTEGARAGRTRSGNLREQVVYPAMYPTPTASAAGTNGKVKVEGKWVQGVPSLDTMARKNLWPTPTSQETGRNLEQFKEYVQKHRNGRMKPCHLSVAVQMYPTPMASDYKAGWGSGDTQRHTPRLQTVVNGKLNPNFVEFLMGYPKNWTEVKPWVMSGISRIGGKKNGKESQG